VSGRYRPRLLLRLAHDDIALFERGAKSREVVLGQLVLVRQSLDVLLLDESTLGGFLEQALGRGEVVQMYRFVQLKSFRSEWAAGVRRPGGIRRVLLRSLLPPIRVIERGGPEVHSQSGDVALVEQSLMSR